MILMKLKLFDLLNIISCHKLNLHLKKIIFPSIKSANLFFFYYHKKTHSNCNMLVNSKMLILLNELVQYIAVVPDAPTIQNNETVNGVLSIRTTEESQLTLTCDSYNGVPAANVSLVRSGSTLHTGINTVTYNKTAERSDDLTSFKCVSTSSEGSVTSQELDIQVYLYCEYKLLCGNCRSDDSTCLTNQEYDGNSNVT